MTKMNATVPNRLHKTKSCNNRNPLSSFKINAAGNYHDLFCNYEIHFHLKTNGNLETESGHSYCLTETELLLVHFQESPPCCNSNEHGHLTGMNLCTQQFLHTSKFT